MPVTSEGPILLCAYRACTPLEMTADGRVPPFASTQVGWSSPPPKHSSTAD